MRIKVNRFIVYEGEEEWVERTLAKSLQLGKTLDCGRGKIHVDNELRTVISEQEVVKGTEEHPNG